MANIAGYRGVVEAAHAFGRCFNGQITVHAFKISIVKSMTMTMSMTKTFMKIPWDKGTSKPLKRQNICQSVLNIISQQFFEYYRY